MAQTKEEIRELAVIATQLQTIALTVQKLEEANEGTHRTPGMKAKVAIAEMNIEANKQAYYEMQTAMAHMEERIGKNLIALSINIEKKIDEKFSALEKEGETQRTFIQRLTPWVNVVTWIVTAAAGIFLSLILTGRLHIGLAP